MATLIHLENQNDCKTATIYDIIEKTELMEVTMSIYESGQMYLETIYILSQKKEPRACNRRRRADGILQAQCQPRSVNFETG